MKNTSFTFLILAFSLFLIAFNTRSQNLKEVNSSAVETNRYEIPDTRVVPIKDSKSGGQYELYIKLPEKYAENKDKNYPVIYFTDAVWHIEILSAATSYLMEDVILVGISWQKDINEDLLKEVGAHVSRYRDYSIRKSSNPKEQAKIQYGQAKNHLDFIREDVIRYVEKNYRTDPKNRSYFGYSMGGKFGAYILLKQPETFKNYILGSPGVSRDNPILSEIALKEASNRKGLNANVFVSYGSLEDKLGNDVDDFITILKNIKDETLSLHHVVIKGTHQTAFPTTGVQGVAWLSDLTKNKVAKPGK